MPYGQENLTSNLTSNSLLFTVYRFLRSIGAQAQAESCLQSLSHAEPMEQRDMNNRD